MRTYLLGSRASEELKGLRDAIRERAKSHEVCLLVAEIGRESSKRRMPLLSLARFLAELVGRRAGTPRHDRQKDVYTGRRRAWKGSIAKVLGWVEGYTKARLPRRAWNGRSFRASAGSAAFRAVADHRRLRSTWSFHLRVLDADDPRLAWNIEAAVDHMIGSDPTLSVRVYFETADESFAPESRQLHVPGFVRDVADEFGLRSGTAQLGAVPTRVRTDAQADLLCAELLDPDRKFADVLLFETCEGGTGALRPDALSRAMAGIAKVFVLSRESALALSEALASDLTADDTAVRVFSPGFSMETAPASQLKFGCDQLGTDEDAQAVARWLENHSAAVSVEEFNVGVDVTPFEEVLRKAKKARKHHRLTRENARLNGELARRDAEIMRLNGRLAMAETDAEPPGGPEHEGEAVKRRTVSLQRLISDAWTSASERRVRAVAALKGLVSGGEKARLRSQLAARDAEVERLQEQVEKERRDVQWLSDEHDRADRAAKAAQKRIAELEPRLGELVRRLRDRGEDPDIPLPDSWSEFCRWCNEHLAGKVLLLPRATRETRNPPFKEVAVAARGLVWLGTKYRNYRIEGKGDDLRGSCGSGSGLSNERCGSDSFPVEWGGRKVQVEWHVKNTNTMDPERCLRIYYFWDARNRQVMVASMPGHV